MTFIAKRFTELLFNNGIILEEDKPIYVYGTEITLNFFITALSMILIGCFLGQFWSTTIYILIFTSLRETAGGYHAKTYLTCYLASLFTYCSIIFTYILVPYENKAIIYIIFLAIGNIYLYLFAPTQNKVNKKTQDELTISRVKMLRRMVIIDVISIALFITGLLNELYFIFSETLIAVAILSLINQLKLRR